VYSRELDGQTYTFGVSGKLWRDALVMYDHQTRSLWSHITGEAVQGKLKGKTLKMLAAMPQIDWKTWRLNFPGTKVLSVPVNLVDKTILFEERRRDSYAQYHASPETGVSGMQYSDARLNNKELVVGVKHHDQHRAYPFSAFEGQPVLNDRISHVPILVFHDQNSSATAVYKRTLDGMPLVFEWSKEYFAVDSSETTWNLITGLATEGKYKGKQLERLTSINVYWFAWARYHPDTTIYGQ
jgi:hypothetical protein